MPEYPGEEHLAIWRKHLVKPCFVYVIRGDDPYIKIGFATDVHKRIASLQTGNPQKLRLLYVLPGGKELEWALHNRMGGRIGGSHVLGEWFGGEKADEMLKLVATMAERMLDEYDGTGRIPDFHLYGTFRRPKQKRGEPPRSLGSSVKIDPNIDAVKPEEAERRLFAHWTRRAKPGCPLDVGNTGTIN